ncbi:MAG: TrmH family RNA methyltransferase [Fusobacteriaceae bacterium]
MEKIISAENNQFKLLKKLKQKKYREEYELYFAEGVKFLDFDIIPEYIIVREDFLDNIELKISNINCKKLLLPQQLFNQLTSQENSQGLILVYKIKYSKLEDFNSNIVILDKVADPGNLGTILRVCDAAGFKDIILVKGCVDIYNEKVVRSSMGSIFGVNFIYLDESEIFKFLKENNYQTFVTALDKTSIEYTSVKLTEKNAFVFGNEGVGVCKEFLDFSDEKVIIPIYGIAESLNVAMASGIFLYKMRELINNK